MTGVISAGGSGAETLAQWDGLWECAVPGIRLRRLAGLGFNPAAPEAVLIGLMELKGNTLDFLWRTNLPPAVVQAAVEHPRWEVRGHMLEAHQRSAISPAQWAYLIEGPTAEPRRKRLIVELCAESGAFLTADLVDRLTRDPAPAVRAAAAAVSGVTAGQIATLVVDSESQVRAAAAPQAWAALDAVARELLLADPEPAVRAVALLCLHQDEKMPIDVLDLLPDHMARFARKCALTTESFRRLADGDPDLEFRSELAENPHLEADQVAELAADEDPWVRLLVSLRPELTEEQRAVIPLEISERSPSNTVPWVAGLHDDPEAMRRLAHSVHPLIRRSVARAAHLPPDVVAHLGRDTDRTVQLFLAESCDDATSEVLLSVAAWWSGSLSHPDRPRSHPNFPRAGLLRFAEDPNPLLRRLALDDPKSDAALAERFVDDPHDLVRARAAVDPRLSASTLDRLLDEPEQHSRAACNPGLPTARLVDLLCSARSARAAAANPRIPAAVMHRMLAEADACGPETSP
jgi:hypothetical protein